MLTREYGSRKKLDMRKTIIAALALLWVPFMTSAADVLGTITARLADGNEKRWLIMEVGEETGLTFTQVAQGEVSGASFSFRAVMSEVTSYNTMVLEAMLMGSGTDISAVTPVITYLPDGIAAPYWKTDEETPSAEIEKFELEVFDDVAYVRGKFSGTLYQAELTEQGESFSYAETQEISGSFDVMLPLR
jgi:hypothetical protein